MKKTSKRIFHIGWTNFKRNSYLSLGTTGVMAMVLLLFGGLMVINYISSEIVGGLQGKVDVSVYFKQDAAEDEIMDIKQDLEDQSQVSSVTYISRDKALEEFKSNHAGDALIQASLSELTDNPLQASLNIKAKDSSQYTTIVSYLEGNKFRPLIDKINFYENEAVINRVQGISNGLRNWGFLATLILAMVAILVTFNTIRLTIYNQKQEIEIMRLVGGSSWHVKAPYLVEGGLYGLFAALIATVLFYPTVWVVSSKAALLLPGISLISYFVANIAQFIFLMLMIGVGLGVISSSVAIRRFLKV
ncbi:ABC transporter permease [Candidatus Parcubacteria bacterium]|nr:ABC transporter permease [Candidatus Parcubacteria bacterium]